MPNGAPLAPDQIFISYARPEHIDAARVLRAEFQSKGLRVFLDEASIRSGDNWIQKLEAALQSCRVFIVLVGQTKIERWVGAEVQIALARHYARRAPFDEAGTDVDGAVGIHPQTAVMRPALPLILPVLVDGVAPTVLPPFLSLFQATPWNQTEMVPSALLDEISKEQPALSVAFKLPHDKCPYQGLASFDSEHAALFFGRRRETLEALAKIGDQSQKNPDGLRGVGGLKYIRWLQIEGASGAGKSSLVKAGMLPAIESGALWGRTGFPRWHILGPMVPGRDPVENLAAAYEAVFVPEEPLRDRARFAAELRQKSSAFAAKLKDRLTDTKTAFVLVVDQFEELYTFAEDSVRRDFEALLVNALQDPACPLFMISTMRWDFTHRIEESTSAFRTLYGDQDRCWHYPLLSPDVQGLQEAIEMPARLAGLDVGKVTAVILSDAEEEIGALPLVENALTELWNDARNRNRDELSDKFYRENGRLAGLLAKRADAFLDSINQRVPEGRRRVLELLLRLTKVNVDGPNTRQRLGRDAAVQVAGWCNREAGEQIVRLLSGADQQALAGASAGAFRLITVEREGALGSNETEITNGVSKGDAQSSDPDRTRDSVNLIHETLIRTRRAEQRTQSNAKPTDLPYWPTLWNYIEASKARAPQRERLQTLARDWKNRTGLGRLLGLAGWSGLLDFRGLAAPCSIEQRYLRWSAAITGAGALVLLSIIGLIGESVYWASTHGLPIDALKTRWSYKLGAALPLPKLVEIPAGKFTMGSETNKDEKPVDSVVISQPFYLAQTETTFEQYDAFAKATARSLPGESGWGRGMQPVINVDWNDAHAYANWLGAMTGKSCRLPSEAEWEYAARAGTMTEYALPADAKGSDDIKDKALANCADCGSKWSGKQTAPVGQIPANSWKLRDMHGNVWEWVEDCHHENYEGAPENGAARQGGTGACQFRVLRGGSWSDDAANARSAARGDVNPGNRYDGIGFRVLCVSPIE